MFRVSGVGPAGAVFAEGSGVGCRVLDIGRRFLWSEFQVSGLGYMVSDFAFRDWCFGCPTGWMILCHRIESHVLGSGSRVSNLGFWGSSFGSRCSTFGSRVLVSIF